MNLTDDLQAAASDPPPTRIDLDQLIAGTQRGMTRRRWMAGAACALALVTVGTTILVRPNLPLPDAAASADRIPDFAKLSSADKVWPKAVHKLPTTLPDGTEYDVASVLGGNRYLVETPRTADKDRWARGPLIFDVKAGTATPLIPADMISDTGISATNLLMSKAVGDMGVVMFAGTRADKPIRAIFFGPLDGGSGRPAVLSTLEKNAAPRFGIAGDSVIWDVQIPGTGNPPKGPQYRVNRYSLATGDPADPIEATGFRVANLSPFITNQTDSSGIAYLTEGQLWNVVTGERLNWVANKNIQGVNCAPTWCVGLGPDERVALQALDGSDYQVLPYRGLLRPAVGGRLAVGNLTVGQEGVHVVWDRETGRAAVVKRENVSGPPFVDGIPRTANKRPSRDFEPSVFTWLADGHLNVLDLAAIK